MTAAPDLLSRLRRTVATLTADYAEHHAENINLKAALKLKSDRLAEAERKLVEAEEDYGARQSTARVAESRAEAAERKLVKMREALEEIANMEGYPPHDPGDYMPIKPFKKFVAWFNENVWGDPFAADDEARP